MRNFLILSLTVFLILPLVQCGKKTPTANSTENNVVKTEESVEVESEKTIENGTEEVTEEVTNDTTTDETESSENVSTDEKSTGGIMTTEDLKIKDDLYGAVIDIINDLTNEKDGVLVKYINDEKS